MPSSSSSVSGSVRALFCIGLILGAGVVQADPPHRGSDRDQRADRGERRYTRGVVVPRLPQDYRVVRHRDVDFYYSGGHWFRPMGARFVVVAPPIGLVVPVLPGGFVTLSIGGRMLYRYDDVYYARDDRGYVVVEPPRQSEAPTYASGQDNLFVYPRLKQSEKAQATDRYECHEWGSAQTGYDPTLSYGGVGPEQAERRRADYLRAMTACLEARGYTVR
ncbi:hypothetical protein J5J83_12115 [Azoarcus sp. L1K30]|uniref:DUF6515 family protein n=1 Tax=Azoarcus sp. L1K30 TaxID=2820277 RepID=UPI001B833D34|nr:DUF6515 family protein [Azoarcus sp. L1K30]MBR0566859.1 hypothetical protein [Azoarcus sp. L1K30]